MKLGWRRNREDGQVVPLVREGRDFNAILAGMIDSISTDPAHMRNAIYELARVKLQEMALQQDPPMNVLETRRLMLALETAIERVETVSSGRDAERSQEPHHRWLIGRSADGGSGKVTVIPPPARSRRIVIDPDEPIYSIAKSALAPARRLAGSGTALAVRLGLLAAVVLALSIALDKRFAQFAFDKSPMVSGETASEKKIGSKFVVAGPGIGAVSARSAAFQLPSVYGVYAVSDGQLRELDALAGRVPDDRVFMSATISKPSRTVLPDGKVTFVIYRRDIATSAPDRLPVRVIAKVVRAMVFEQGGKVQNKPIEGTWAIRNLSYDFRVAPLNDNPEMLIAQPARPDFMLAAGRYGLVLKGQAYDFTVAGPIADTAHCLERVEAANGSFYNECRKI